MVLITSAWDRQTELHISLLNRVSHARDTIGGQTVYHLNKGEACEAFILNYLVQTSTVVFRWSTMRSVRFDTTLRAAGEDNLFWIECAALSRMVTIDTALGARCLDGVNIYDSASWWDSHANVARVGYLLLLWTKATQRFDHDKRLSALLNARRKNFERAFSFFWIRSFLLRRRLHAETLRMLHKADKTLFFRLLGATISTVGRYIFKRRTNFVEH